ncbi:hypothetical protein [Tsukamurella spumae]|uniref:hypothetical protein n=1 Tax=Tsukamurella spumae TaxID=44753 RepID=UPI001FE8924A|nr:hypothetical protein [Tsukamurella spumae]
MPEARERGGQQVPLRGAVDGARLVDGEQAGQSALAGGDERQVVRGGDVIEVLGAHRLDVEAPAGLLEQPDAVVRAQSHVDSGSGVGEVGVEGQHVLQGAGLARGEAGVHAGRDRGVGVELLDEGVVDIARVSEQDRGAGGGYLVAELFGGAVAVEVDGVPGAGEDEGGGGSHHSGADDGDACLGHGRAFRWCDYLAISVREPAFHA